MLLPARIVVKNSVCLRVVPACTAVRNTFILCSAGRLVKSHPCPSRNPPTVSTTITATNIPDPATRLRLRFSFCSSYFGAFSSVINQSPSMDSILLDTRALPKCPEAASCYCHPKAPWKTSNSFVPRIEYTETTSKRTGIDARSVTSKVRR